MEIKLWNVGERKMYTFLWDLDWCTVHLYNMSKKSSCILINILWISFLTESPWTLVENWVFHLDKKLIGLITLKRYLTIIELIGDCHVALIDWTLCCGWTNNTEKLLRKRKHLHCNSQALIRFLHKHCLSYIRTQEGRKWFTCPTSQHFLKS